MPHFESHFVPPERIVDAEVFFPAEEVRHLAVVLRKRAGDRIWVVDGRGSVYEVSLVLVTRREVRGKILRSIGPIGEQAAGVDVAAGVVKGERFDWLVEKAVELGASRVLPFVSATSAIVPRSRARFDRWRKVALAAMKQCGRSVLTDVCQVRGFGEILAECQAYDDRFAAAPAPEGRVLDPAWPDRKNLPRGKGRRILLAVGPEGGFDQEETERMKALGFSFVSLGPRRLRTETACLALLTLVMSRLEARDVDGYAQPAWLLE